MADGTESPVSDGSSVDSPSVDSPEGTNAQLLNADTGRVARIVAALRKAHAEQAAATSAAAVAEPVAASATGTVTDRAEGAGAVATSAGSADTATGSATGSTAQIAQMPDVPAPRRETSGVRSPAPKMPTLRWNPGARYRASRLADRPALPASSAPVPGAPAAGPAGHAPVPPPPVPGPPVAGPPVPLPPVAGPPPLAGRLYRGPARRTGVFDREIWYPAARSSRVPRDVSDALVRAVERYRMGSISTSGLVRAIGRAHAA